MKRVHNVREYGFLCQNCFSCRGVNEIPQTHMAGIAVLAIPQIYALRALLFCLITKGSTKYGATEILKYQGHILKKRLCALGVLFIHLCTKLSTDYNILI